MTSTYSRTRRRVALAALSLTVAGVGCAPASSGATAASTPAPTLPPIPMVEGALVPRVQYPRANALIEARDSNFIFGTVGTGRATLTINGMPVSVMPNGAFLGWLPVPPAALPQYELVTAAGADTVRLVHPVRIAPPRAALEDTGVLVVDSASLTPRGTLALRDDEPVRVSIRAPRSAQVWLGRDSARTPLLPGLTRDSLTVVAEVPYGTLRAARSALVVVARGADTVRLPLGVVDSLAPPPGSWAVLGADSVVVAPGAIAPGDTDRVIVGRPIPGGTYKWFLLPGTVLPVTGRAGNFVRVRLDADLEIWVQAEDARLLAPGSLAPRRVASNARVVPAPAWVDLVIPIGDRPPFLVEQDGNRLVLTLYGTQATTDIIQYAANDSLVRTVEWAQERTDRARYTLHLASRPFGYLVMWDSVRAALVLRVRRPPAVDPRAPLRGLTIAVDAGHPPSGATGPTGLYEADATLPIAQQLQTMLEARGARVVMTRTTPDPVALADRPIIARRADAHALVSIHLNALPDGVNPFNAHGTGTYFFHAQSEPLARAVQRGMVARMGLRNLGVYYDNLALARPTWMPAVLCEGAFLMIPEQEAALRTPEFQARYARGVADGIEAFFRTLPR